MTPELHLATLYNFDGARSTTAREPNGAPAPLFALVRGMTSCAWAIRADIAAAVAAELDALAREELSLLAAGSGALHAVVPRHADRYRALVGESAPIEFGPAFAFPDDDTWPTDDAIVFVDDEARLARNFCGWLPNEIAEGRAPVAAIIEDGAPVSICFCARTSEVAAEAGLETAAAYRKRGYAARVTAAWARAIRASGRIPLYSTSWANHASLAVAKKLGLVAYASTWSITSPRPRSL
jgi:hypothetical protein